MGMPLQVEAVVSSHNAKVLRKLVDHVNTHIHSLKSLGVTQDSYSSLLCPVLVNKLPPDLQLTVSHKASETDWNLTSLMQAIEKKMSARESECQPDSWSNQEEGTSTFSYLHYVWCRCPLLLL